MELVLGVGAAVSALSNMSSRVLWICTTAARTAAGIRTAAASPPCRLSPPRVGSLSLVAASLHALHRTAAKAAPCTPLAHLSYSRMVRLRRPLPASLPPCGRRALAAAERATLPEQGGHASLARARPKTMWALQRTWVLARRPARVFKDVGKVQVDAIRARLKGVVVDSGLGRKDESGCGRP